MSGSRRIKNREFSNRRVEFALQILKHLHEGRYPWPTAAYLERLVCVNSNMEFTDLSLTQTKISVTVDPYLYDTVNTIPHVMIHNHPMGHSVTPSQGDWEFVQFYDRFTAVRCMFYMVVNYNFTLACMYRRTPHSIKYIDIPFTNNSSPKIENGSIRRGYSQLIHTHY